MPQKVLAHLKKNDPVLHQAILACGACSYGGPETKTDLFSSLCRIIIAQQLSGKAATSLWRKFKNLFPRRKPSAKMIFEMTAKELRASGISFAKIRALKDLSEKVLNRTLKLNALKNSHEEIVRTELQKVIGIGPWTSDMFLMFALGNEDIFSPGDLGLRKGIQKVYGLDTLPSAAYMKGLSFHWSPYKTYAACALWFIVDNQ
tara:strand:- start:9225 stop:9833 length:609 start_codon:yes stop_codon:yes gene_type:complete